MDSTTLTVVLAIAFAVIGIGSTLIYYFARYYFKTDHSDKELLTKKPVEIGLAKDATASGVTAPAAVTAAPPPTPSTPKPAQVGSALSQTRSSFWGRISSALSGNIKGNIRDELEEILYTSDLGPQTAETLLAQVSEGLSRNEKSDLNVVRVALRERLEAILKAPARHELFENTKAKPTVWMVVGVNGVGKTTTIGKLAAQAQARGLKTIIVAGDTFRAAADSQLKVWAERSGAEIYNPENVKDPSAVAYAALEHGKAAKADLIIVDTAGRLHTQDHLMEELKKMKRVMTKILPEAPQERLLVIDANAGQNALIQARQFNEAVGLTGVIVTKMDGSAKGGIVVGIASELNLPVTHIGIGEAVEDLRAFSINEFVEAIL